MSIHRLPLEILSTGAHILPAEWEIHLVLNCRLEIQELQPERCSELPYTILVLIEN